ncbi:serine/threonine protein kinase [Sorangium sp. So ce1389]|uniref:serine/threonine protein kinase n=1 Tax=Sorangium sp. So ce1389 TaxID=3133336 RepID=UPI003F5DD855
MTEAHQQQRYRVVERLASGGMAEVFLAESAGIEGFKKQVAIKRVLPHLSEKKRFIAMFLDEARLSAHLSHSNVAQVFDIGVGDNAYFIVMEYVDGADLKAVLESMRKAGRTLPVESAVFITAKLCEGLTYAHELKGADGHPLKVVHRDMSPPNVLITKYGEVKIVDFGLAKATSQLEKSEAGIIKGKFSYLSPEAAQGLEVDHRTDIFAVGAILWEMLAGKRLFLGDTDYQTVKLVQQAQIPPLSEINKAVPPELDRLIARSLAREPGDRYGSAREFGRDLTTFLYRFGRPVSAYDIAEHVRSAMALRRRAPASEKASFIDRLIEETLLEFTSLPDDKAAPSTARLNEPLKISAFEDIGKWADEIKVSAPGEDLMRRSLAAVSVEAGNLAALEEPELVAPPATLPAAPPRAPSPTAEPPRAPFAPAVPRVPSPTAEPPRAPFQPAEPPRAPFQPAEPPRAPFQPAEPPPGPVERRAEPTLASPQLAPAPQRPAPPPPAAAPLAVAPPRDLDPEPAPAFRSGGGAVKAVLLVAALAVLAAGAWLGGLIPH